MNKKIKILFLTVSILVISIVSYVVFGLFSLREIPKSHIDGNVPDASNFSNYLNRDLTEYFSKKLNKNVSVSYELLRDTPTQTGIAFPKYYAWVKILEGDKVIGQGAVRVAAQEKQYFVVTDYLSSDDIKADPSKVITIFPKNLSDKIILKSE